MRPVGPLRCPSGRFKGPYGTFAACGRARLNATACHVSYQNRLVEAVRPICRCPRGCVVVSSRSVAMLSMKPCGTAPHYRKKLQTVWHIVCIDPRVCQTTFCMSYCLPKTFCMPNCSPNMILFGNLFLFAHSFCHLLFCLPNCMRNDQIVCGIFILVDKLLDKL